MDQKCGADNKAKAVRDAEIAHGFLKAVF